MQQQRATNCLYVLSLSAPHIPCPECSISSFVFLNFVENVKLRRTGRMRCKVSYFFRASIVCQTWKSLHVAACLTFGMGGNGFSSDSHNCFTALDRKCLTFDYRNAPHVYPTLLIQNIQLSVHVRSCFAISNYKAPQDIVGWNKWHLIQCHIGC